MDLQAAQTVVLDMLQKASNQNPDVLKPAEQKLREWETQPGFYTILFNVVSNHTIDSNVRWMAVLYFKNGIDKYWRKNAPNAISEEEKVALRQGLVSNFHEPVNQIALQLAVLVSKVARYDCPREWPQLVPTLLSAVESNDPITQHRALLMMHHVIKTLSSKRLAGDRKLFQDLTENIYTYVLNLWNNYTEVFLRHMAQNSPVETITENLEKALLTLRVLRKLTVHGFKKPHESQDVVNFMNVVFDRARATLESRKQLRGKGIYLLELCEKFIIHLTKILTAVLETHPFSYVNFIQPTLEFCVFYLFTAEGSHLLYERFIIQCFNLIKRILLCAEYKPNKVLEMTKDPETVRAHQIKMNFFQSETLVEICRKLVSHYFLLKQDDLEMWDADPESFATDEGGESWKYSLRPSTETVFVALFHEFGSVLCPVLLEMINASRGLVPPSDLAAILQKDAIYSAAGLAASRTFHLFDEINFDQWFTTTLTQELKVKDNNYRIIRRRVAWLIGMWTTTKLCTELWPSLYETLLQLLQPDEDMAVRLAASTTLRRAIDDFDFDAEQFLTYLEPMFGLLFSLLKEAHECDTKMHVLNVLSLLVERIGSSIRPYADSLVAYLPLLWIESEEHNMLRCAIVATLVHLVKALGVASVGLNEFLLPVIRLGTDVNQNAIVYLLEDCLELWLAVLENSAIMTDELMQLFNTMHVLIDTSTENLRMCLSIIQAYVILAPEQTIMMHGPSIITVLDSILGDMRSDGIVMVMRLIETCLRAAPLLAVDVIKTMLPRIFEAIHRGEDLPMVMSVYLSVISRVLLISPEAFSAGVAQLAQGLDAQPDMVLKQIINVWIRKMPQLSQLEREKLLALAFCSLLTAQSRPVLECFAGIVSNIVEVLNDVLRTDEMGVVIDSLMLLENVSPSAFHDEVDYETEHDHRRKQLTASDPVHNIQLKDFFHTHLMNLERQVGPEQFQILLQTLDEDIRSQLRDLLGI